MSLFTYFSEASKDNGFIRKRVVSEPVVSFISRQQQQRPGSEGSRELTSATSSTVITVFLSYTTLGLILSSSNGFK